MESSATPAGAAPTAAAAQDAALNMLMVRFAGEHAARQALAESGSKKHEDKKEPQVELFIEANEHGRRRVVAPKTGTAAFAKTDILGWGVFGVAVGLIVGFAGGDGGVLGAIESGLLIGVLWGIFGAVAGALYGMWAGRGVSARRLKGLGAFVPPDSSLALAWAEGSLSPESDRALGRDRLAAADPALQPSRPRRRVGGVKPMIDSSPPGQLRAARRGLHSGRGTSRPSI